MRFPAITLLAVLLTVTAAGQKRVTVSGYVREAGSREPLVGAAVVSGRQGSAANGSGFYSFSLESGAHTLTCSYLGYHTATLEVLLTTDTIVNILLEPSAAEIRGVVVTGNTADVPVAQRFGRLDVNMAQLKYMPLFAGEQDIFKYFQLLPGVTGGREGSSEINIRGGSSDQTLILLDDVPVYNPNHALGFLSIFNGNTLGSAELYKGGIPATLGGRLSGIASMTTREGDKETHRQNLTVGTLTVSLFAEGPLKRGRSSYLFSGRYFSPNLLVGAAMALKKPDTRANYMFYDVTGKLDWQLGTRNHLSWSVYTGRDAATFMYEERDQVRREDFTTEKMKVCRNDGGFYWGSVLTALKLNTLLKRGGFRNTTLYYSGLTNLLKTEYTNYIDEVFFNASNGSKLDEFGLRSVTQRNLGKQTLSYGFQATYQKILPREVRSESLERETRVVYDSRELFTGALFLDDNIDLGKVGIHAGIRAPLYYNRKKFSYALEPRLGISYTPGRKNTFFLSYDRNTQPLLSLRHQNGGVPIDFWMPLKDDQLQTSDQLSAGWKYRPVESIFISLEAFHKRMNNLYFVYDENEMLTCDEGYDRGGGKASGAEFMIQYTGRKTMIVLSYTQTSSKRIVDGVTFDFMYDTPFDLNLFGRFKTLDRGPRAHYLSANLSWRSGFPYMLSKEIYPTVELNGPQSFVPNNPLHPNTRLINYFRLDLNYSMEKRLRNGRREWQFSVLNATNYFNPYMVVVKSDRLEGISILPIMPSFAYKRYW